MKIFSGPITVGGDEAGYRRAYEASLDQAIEAGFLLLAHRDELLVQAETVAFPPLPVRP